VNDHKEARAEVDLGLVARTSGLMLGTSESRGSAQFVVRFHAREHNGSGK